MEKQTSIQKVFSKTPVLILGAMLCCALWGGAFPAIKVGYKIFGIGAEETGLQIIFAGCRFMLAGVLALLIGSVLHGEILLPKKKSIPMILVLALLQTFLQYVFFYVGLAHTTGVKSSIIEALNVFVALLVAALLFKQERLTAPKVIGCILGFAGVVIINLSGSGFNLDMTFWGEGCIFISTIAYAFSSVFIKRFSRYERPFTLSSYQFMVGGFGLCMAGLGMWDYKHFMGAEADQKRITEAFAGVAKNGTETVLQAVLILLLLAGISAVAYSLWGVLLKYNEVSRVAVYGFLTPIFGVLFSTIFLKEDSAQSVSAVVIALILVSAGTLLAQKK